MRFTFLVRSTAGWWKWISSRSWWCWYAAFWWKDAVYLGFVFLRNTCCKILSDTARDTLPDWQFRLAGVAIGSSLRKMPKLVMELPMFLLMVVTDGVVVCNDLLWPYREKIHQSDAGWIHCCACWSRNGRQRRDGYRRWRWQCQRCCCWQQPYWPLLVVVVGGILSTKMPGLLALWILRKYLLQNCYTVRSSLRD